MKKINQFLLIATICFAGCNNIQSSGNDNDSTSAASSVNSSTDWKFGVALWTFHDVNFPQSLDKVDSAGLVYIGEKLL